MDVNEMMLPNMIIILNTYSSKRPGKMTPYPMNIITRCSRDEGGIDVEEKQEANVKLRKLVGQNREGYLHRSQPISVLVFLIFGFVPALHEDQSPVTCNSP